MQKIKRDDNVVVIAGKDKGKQGRVTRLLADGRLVVSGANMIKKHRKANPQMGVQGGIIEQEAPIDASNVAIYNPRTQKADRVGFRVENGDKVRFFKSDNERVDA